MAIELVVKQAANKLVITLAIILVSTLAVKLVDTLFQPL